MSKWPDCPLGKVVRFQRGLTYSKQDEVDVSNVGVLRATNIDLLSHKLDFSEIRYISNDFLVPKNKKLQKGSILMCTASGSKSHLGKVALVDSNYPYAFGGFMAQLTPISSIDSRFLYYQLIGPMFKKYLDRVSEGVNIQNLKWSQIEEFPILLPPLSEQKAIVAKLDKTFEAIDQAKAKIEKNIANAKELFQSKLDEVFGRSDRNWSMELLENITTKIQDGAHHSPKVKYQTAGADRFPYITSRNIRNTGLDLSKLEYCDFAFHEKIYQRCNPELGDLLLTKDGANTGNVSVNTLEDPFSLLSSVCLIKPDPEKVRVQYLWYYLQSPRGLEAITGQMTGAAIKRIILKTIKKAIVPIPKDLKEQEGIIRELNEVNEKCRILVSKFSQMSDSLNLVKESVLRMQFKR